ncbi:MAG: rhomboid family intramembrane serine protease [Candidatus Zixiibacteriota bacterium]
MFLPLKDDNPTLRKPYVTIGLIALNTIVYLFTDLFQSYQMASFLSFKYGLIPYEITHLEEISAQAAQQIGQLRGFASEDISVSIMATPFTSMFMHGGFMHLAGNMLYLWIYGNNIEDYFGHVRFLLFYLVGGLAAVALHIAISPGSPVPLIGASGAISAVLGAYFVLYPRARVLVLIFFFFITTMWLPASVVLGFYFVMQLLSAVAGLGGASGGGVAWFAHIGGFAFGWALLRLLVKKRGPSNFGGGDRARIYRVKF